MDVQLIARDPHALQQPVGIDMIQALCTCVRFTDCHSVHP